MRAVKDSLAALLNAKWGKTEGPRLGSWYVSACQWVAAENVARIVETHPSHPGDNVHKQAWKDHFRSLAVTLLGIRHVVVPPDDFSQ